MNSGILPRQNQSISLALKTLDGPQETPRRASENIPEMIPGKTSMEQFRKKILDKNQAQILEKFREGFFFRSPRENLERIAREIFLKEFQEESILKFFQKFLWVFFQRLRLKFFKGFFSASVEKFFREFYSDFRLIFVQKFLSTILHRCFPRNSFGEKLFQSILQDFIPGMFPGFLFIHGFFPKFLTHFSYNFRVFFFGSLSKLFFRNSSRGCSRNDA